MGHRQRLKCRLAIFLADRDNSKYKAVEGIPALRKAITQKVAHREWYDPSRSGNCRDRKGQIWAL